MLKCSRWLLFTHSVSVTFPRKLGGFFCVFLTSWWVFQVPSGLRGQAHLKVWGNRHLAGDGYIFHNYTTVTIDSKGSSVFIQTDKPVYKPKQKGKVTLQNLPDAWAAFKQNLQILGWEILLSVGCADWYISSFPFFSVDKPLYGDFWLETSQWQGKENWFTSYCKIWWNAWQPLFYSNVHLCRNVIGFLNLFKHVLRLLVGFYNLGFYFSSGHLPVEGE